MNLTPAASDLLERMSEIYPDKREYWCDLAERLARSQGSRTINLPHMEGAIYAASPEFVEVGE